VSAPGEKNNDERRRDKGGQHSQVYQRRLFIAKPSYGLERTFLLCFVAGFAEEKERSLSTTMTECPAKP